MDIREMISTDVWIIIEDNYEKGSHTTAITNLLQHVNEIVQEINTI